MKKTKTKKQKIQEIEDIFDGDYFNVWQHSDKVFFSMGDAAINFPEVQFGAFASDIIDFAKQLEHSNFCSHDKIIEEKEKKKK